MSNLRLFASCARGLETLLAKELAALGASAIKETVAGVSCEASLEEMYRIGYCARLPSRWLLRLAEGEISNPDDLYELARTVAWHEHFALESHFAIHVSGKSPAFRDTRFAMLRVKDAVSDNFRELTGERPSIDSDDPDALIHVALKGSKAAVALDLVGGALHERGYRQSGHEAPIKENLAAALLVRAGWPQMVEANPHIAVVDPFCGGATLLVEALWMAAGVPAQWLRQFFAWNRWTQHDAAAWERVRAERDALAQAGLRTLQARGFGSDDSAQTITLAKRTLQAAGLSGFVQLNVGDSRRIEPPADFAHGLIVANLPYGERMGFERELMPIHREFGTRLKAVFPGWRFALLTGSEALARATEVRAERIQKIFNGSIECKLITGTLAASAPAPATDNAAPAVQSFRSPGAEAVFNRINKNRRNLKRWLARENISCYRVYDADIPEYAAAIDVYNDRLHIQEYAPPADIPIAKAEERLKDLVFAARRAFEAPSERVYLKQRRAQTPDDQYRRHDQTKEFFTVTENGAQYSVNLTDYLDTGLFLDGRQIRAWLVASARGVRFLNLFSYTASATVAAALGGARESVSVDLSPTYTAWAERNFRLNGLDLNRHKLVEADVVRWLVGARDGFDLIYVDPPTFSNSKRTTTVFDVQRDHFELLQACLTRLSGGGRILFVCNLRRFKLDPRIEEIAEVEDVTHASIPQDFARDQRIHRAYWVRRRA